MRIVMTSDIHYHYPWHDSFVQMVDQLRQIKPDLMILAGDIGEPLDIFAQGLRVFEPVCENRAALAGNHDVWHRTFTYTSQELWESKLAEVARENGYTWLDSENILMDGLGIAGSLAWYDYGSKHNKFPLSDDEYERIKPMISNDGNYVDWSWSDREFARRLSDELCTRIEELENNPDVSDILVVTHVPVFRGLQRASTNPESGIADAYYGNAALGERIKQYGKVRVVLSGHVHQGKHLQIARNGLRSIDVYTNSADYGKPAALLLDTETWQVTVIGNQPAA